MMIACEYLNLIPLRCYSPCLACIWQIDTTLYYELATLLHPCLLSGGKHLFVQKELAYTPILSPPPEFFHFPS
jgi:hypothetical protein